MMVQGGFPASTHVAKKQVACHVIDQPAAVLSPNMPPVDVVNLTYSPVLVVSDNFSRNSTWRLEQGAGLSLTPLALNFLAVGVVASLTVICGGIYAYIRYLDKRKITKFRGERSGYLKQCRQNRIPPRKSVRRKTRTRYAMAIKMKPRR